MGFTKGETYGLNNYLLHCPFLRSLNGEERYVWYKDNLRPYLLYLHKGQAVDSFFGGIVFEACRGDDGSELCSKSLGFGKLPTLGSWQHAIEELFRPGQNLAAAVELSKEFPVGKTVDIWIALPYPVVGQQAFGIIEEQNLHFRQNPHHREIALKWWIDQVTANWKNLIDEMSDHHVRFCGFVWSKSSLAPNDEQLVLAVNSYVHELGYLTIWTHNYGSLNGHEYKKIGFDFALTRPTYLGTKDRGLEWVQNAAYYSSAYEKGMILWLGGVAEMHKKIELLNLGCSSFMEAMQLFEIPVKNLQSIFESEDPMYVYLYAYIKQAYQTIVLPASAKE